MKTEKKNNYMIRIIWWLAIAGMLLYVYRYEILDLANKFFYKEYTLEELAMEQKVEDFEKFYSVIIESVPFLQDVKDLYGIDFVNRKEYYLSEIKTTTNNLEYYGVMKAIATDVSSFHTDVCFPMYSNLQGLDCYNSEDVVNQLGMKTKVDAWWEEIENGIKEYDDGNLINVVYVDGKYIVDSEDLPEKYKDIADCELISVDGILAEQYIVEHIAIFELQYDYQLKQTYRKRWVFNDKKGNSVKVVWKKENGEELEQTLYVNKGAEVDWAYGYLFEDSVDYYGEDVSQDVVIKQDEDNQLEYIKISNFNNYYAGQQLKEYLMETPYKKIIIDLRDNYGGSPKYAAKYLFPALYGLDIEFVHCWKTPDTEDNKKMTHKLGVYLNYLDKKKDGYYYYTETIQYEGKQSDEKDVYYLIDSGTGSAADGYIAMIKENNLGTIVGTNTGGEGLGASYICDVLENSNLVYIYYPSVPIDEKETYNYCCGTAPDVYVTQTKEDYYLQQNYYEKGIVDEYNTQLEYDTVLKWVIAQ